MIIGEEVRMDNNLLTKKRRILQRIPREEYRDIIHYIRKVYLADYQLKILMARKFSNMFFAMLPLALHENGNNLVYQFQDTFKDRDEPVIISDRALIFLKEQIVSGKYRKILLADDIIIHGRTLDMVYRLLQSWFQEGGVEDYEIRVFAYVESREGLLENMEFASNKESMHVYSTGRWRAVSNAIVNIFYLSGATYTSYVPNLRIKKESKIGHVLEACLRDPQKGFVLQTCRDMRENLMDAYVYVDEKPPKFALNCNVRIYEYADLSEYVIVPMVMMKPMEQSTLLGCLEKAEPVMNPEFVSLLKKNEETYKENDVLYRVLVYVISALWGWKFMYDLLTSDIDFPEYEVQQEQVNFSYKIMKKILSEYNVIQQVDTVWQSIEREFREIENIDTLIIEENDFKELTELFEDNKKVFEDNEPGQHDRNDRMLLSRYLYLNGLLDEKRCEESRQQSENHVEDKFKKSKRLIGFPLYQFVKELGGLSKELICAILYAIDFGKGSIVSRKICKNGKTYFMSVIHAGEQNYKYYENEYFPFLYGLYHLEYTARTTDKLECLEKWKEMFMSEYSKYWERKNHFSLKEDLKILGEMEVEKNYGRVILEAAWERFSQEDTVQAINIAKRITR